MLSNIKCLQCGKEFKRNHAHYTIPKYCSDVCVRIAHTPPLNICVYCGVKFKGRYRAIKYCSTKCRQKASSRFSYVCIDCGKGVSQKRVKRRRECYDKLHRTKHPKRTARCKNCGLPTHRGNGSDFCKYCLPRKYIPIKQCPKCLKVMTYKERICPDCGESPKRKAKRRNSQIYKGYKDSLRMHGCSSCGYKVCIRALEFHHIGKGKDKDISRLKSLKQIREEITEHIIVVLCANCHREVHDGLLDDKSLIPFKLVVSKPQLFMFPQNAAQKQKGLPITGEVT